MRTVARIIHFLIAFELSTLSYGQLPVREVSGLSLRFEHLSIDHGLSQGMINDLALDSTGYLWIATKDGLNRYDGSGFKVFRNESTDPESVSENFISNLHVDRQGRLWVATQSRGLNLYDPTSERFLRINTDNSALSSDFLGVIKEDEQGNILVQTLNEEGYNVLVIDDSEKPIISRSIEVEPLEKVYPGLWSIGGGKDWSKDVDFMLNGAVWYCLRDTVYRIEEPRKSDGTILRFPIVQSRGQLHEDGSKILIGPNKTTVCRVDSMGVLAVFDQAEREFIPSAEIPMLKHTRGRLFINRYNDIWAFNHSDKLLHLNLQESVLSCYDPNWEQLEDGVRNFRLVELQDNTGNLWIGTGGNGLLLINPESLRFKKFINDPAVGGHPEKDGRISLFRTSTKTSKAKYDAESANAWLDLISKVKSSDAKIDFGQNYTHISRDEGGDFWISGIYSDLGKDCIIRIDGELGVVDRIVCGVSPDQARWFGHPIFLLSNGSVWFSEKGMGGSASLYELDPATHTLRSFKFPVETKKYQYRLVSDWYEDRKNDQLWLATTHGLFSFNLTSEKWRVYQHDPTNKTGPSSNMLLSIAPDPLQENVVWIGTEGAGLDRLNVDSGTFSNFNTAHGLPNNVVYAIQSDDEGNLWVSTNNGLSRFKPGTELEFTNYNKSDGLPGNEFNRYEFSKSENGELFFGGTSGLVHFDPRLFNIQRPASRAVINELKVLNEPVVFGQENSILSQPIEMCKNLVFRPDQDMISFGFTMLDFSNTAKQSFKYRLRGYAEEWIDAGNDRSATYTNLSPGDYTFEVLGRNSTGVWSAEPTSLEIKVLPPWNATWWFRALIVLTFISLTYLLYRYRLNQLLRIERIRNRIAQDLHDEIGSTLSSVSLFSSILKKNLKDPDEKSVALLDKIASSTSETMESMNDMVWSIKADNDRFELVINRMRAFAVGLCEAKGVQLHFKEDNRAVKLNLDMQTRKNLYLIFKEAINNSIKYSKAATLFVVIEANDDELHILIEDDGIGFDQKTATNDPLNLGGNGVRGMKKRAMEIGAELIITSEKGTVVLLKMKL